MGRSIHGPSAAKTGTAGGVDASCSIELALAPADGLVLADALAGGAISRRAARDDAPGAVRIAGADGGEAPWQDKADTMSSHAVRRIGAFALLGQDRMGARPRVMASRLRRSGLLAVRTSDSVRSIQG